MALLCMLTTTWAQAQYCTTNLHQNTCGQNGAANLDLLNAQNQAFAPAVTATCPSQNPYISFVAGTDTLVLQQGQDVSLSFRAVGNVSVSAWIDYDGNGTWEQAEWINLSRNARANSTYSAIINAPFTSRVGVTRMRIRTRVLPSNNGAADACTRFLSGLTYDFNVRILPGPSCTGVPDQPIIAEERSKVCAGDSVRINILNPPTTGGINYQWETSPDGFLFTPLAGRTGTSVFIRHSSIVGDTIWVRVTNTCQTSQQDNGSVMIPIMKEEPRFCPCSRNMHTNACDTDYFLDSLSQQNTQFLPTLPNVCVPGSYYRMGDAPTEVMVLEQGTTARFTIRVAALNVSASVFLDANADGVFTADEWADWGRNVPDGTPTVVTFAVPSNAQVGLTTFRIRLRGAGPENGPLNACSPFPSGVTYDFKAMVMPGAPCAITPANLGLSTGNTNVCGYDSSTVSLSNPPQGAGVEVRWYTSVGGVNYTEDPSRRNQVYRVVGSRMLRDSLFVYAEVSCVFGGQVLTTAPALYIKQRPIDCYCTRVQQNGGCSTFFTAFRIVNSTLNFRQRACPRGGTYHRYPAFDSTSATLQRGIFHRIEYTLATQQGNMKVSAWVDLNQDGAFGANEWLDLGRAVANSQPQTVNILLNNAALVGRTTMRMRFRAVQGANENVDACTLFNSGATVDIPITITATPVALDEAQETALRLYPNPTQGTVHLEFGGQMPEVKSVSVLDATGRQTVLPFQATDQELTTQLPATPGIYTLQVVTAGGVVYRRVVVG